MKHTEELKINGLKKHKKHYYVVMEGHKVCAKCYALKIILSHQNDCLEEVKKKVEGMKAIQKRYKDTPKLSKMWLDGYDSGWNYSLKEVLVRLEENK